MKTIQPQTISDLEFDRVLDQLAQRALTQGGKTRCRAIMPMIDAAAIERALKEVEEYKASIGSDQSFPGHHFDALTEVLHQLSIENSVLELNGFKKIKHVCLTTEAIKRFLKKFDQFYVVLNQYAVHIPYEDQPVILIDSVLDRFGQVKDDASQELLHLRKSILKVKSSINRLVKPCPAMLKQISSMRFARVLSTINASWPLRQCTEKRSKASLWVSPKQEVLFTLNPSKLWSLPKNLAAFFIKKWKRLNAYSNG
jgi:hypothetical protein